MRWYSFSIDAVSCAFSSESDDGAARRFAAMELPKVVAQRVQTLDQLVEHYRRVDDAILRVRRDGVQIASVR